jgi:hypothetical protein
MAAETVPTFLEVSSFREQATFDTFERFDQYDAVSHVKGTLEFEPIQGNNDLDEAVGTASYQGSTLAQKGCTWSGTFKLKPKNPSNIDADLNQYNDGSGTVVVKAYDVSDTVNGPAVDLASADDLDAFTAAYQLLPDAASEAVGDGFIIMHAKQFSSIQFDDLSTGSGSVATWGGDGGKYQYSTGDGTWSDLTVTDGTDATAGDGLRTLQQTGSILFTIPEDWASVTIDGDTGYAIRYYITAAQLTQTALIDTTNKDEPFVVNVDQMCPDIRALLKAAMGWESVTGISSVVYKLSDTNVPAALQGQKNLEGLYQENVSGCMVGSMTMNCPVNEDPTFEFEGMGSRYGRMSKDVIGSGGIATAATSLPLNDASRGSVIEPCVIQIGDDDNSSTGYIATAHSDMSGSADATVSPGLAGAGESAGEVIKPFVPSSRDESGTVLAGINYALTIDGVTLGHLDLTVKLTTAYKILDNESGSNRPTGIAISKMRMIEFEASGYLKTGATGSAPISGRAFDNPSHDVDLTIGSASGSRFKVSIPACEGRVQKTDMPKDDLVMVTIMGRAKQASSSGDEFALTLD